MHQIGHLLRIALLMLAVLVGSPLHANELEVCIPADAQVAGHFDGDGDQTPSDANEHATHHHGGCSGHQFASVNLNHRAYEATLTRHRISRDDNMLFDAALENLLRPPIA